MMYRSDMYFKTDPELSAIAMEFAQDQDQFLRVLADAWTLLMNADMFDGPHGLKCNNQDNNNNNNTTTQQPNNGSPTSLVASTSVLLFTIILLYLNIQNI